MTVYESRKPEPYIKTTCKECQTQLEFLPDIGVKSQTVQVKCWSCHKQASYEVDSTGKGIKNNNNNNAKTRTSRRRGNGMKKENLVLCFYCRKYNNCFDRRESGLDRVLRLAPGIAHSDPG